MCPISEGDRQAPSRDGDACMMAGADGDASSLPTDMVLSWC